jgi:hypothetical protein
MTGIRYVITVRGIAGPSVRAVLGDVELSVQGDSTQLRSQAEDQVDLYALLRRLRDLGLEVLDVHEEGTDQAPL